MVIMHIIARSIRLANELAQDSEQRVAHFAFAYRRNTLLAIGCNEMRRPSPKSLRFARKFRISHWLEYPFMHAELDVIIKLWGRIFINQDLSLVLIRTNHKSGLQNSKPCKNCQKILNILNISKVYWSTPIGMISA